MEDLNINGRQKIQEYDPAVLNNFKRVLQIQLDLGKPQSFEITMDGLKVVPRTHNVALFDTYKEFLHESAKLLEVIIFRGIKTPNCTTHYFRFPNKELNTETPSLPPQPAIVPQPQYLNGTEIPPWFKEMMEKERLINKVQQLEEKLAEKEKKLADAEEYMGKLQDGVERVKLELESSKSVWGERLLELAKNPPHWVQMMIASRGNFTPVNDTEQLQGNVTFSKKQKQPEISEEQERHMEVIRQMEELLDEKDLDLMMQINDKLIQDPKLIPEVADLVGIPKA